MLLLVLEFRDAVVGHCWTARVGASSRSKTVGLLGKGPWSFLIWECCATLAMRSTIGMRNPSFGLFRRAGPSLAPW